ncbi:hypothetical protein ANN_20865 [Periplaneta americana]|uniref:BRCT domain-containing protein n=1 Tax=Periplaneta americana TaxID=6978 RepID=A0ABQ8SDT1_PERAM|nr:hypothetical protein ANN_20865 [Periplaneta americana]
MAGRDILSFIDENDMNVNQTPDRRVLRSSLSRSRQSSIRKSGKFRRLYTPNKTNEDGDQNEDNFFEPNAKRQRLSAVSHNATIGNGSHIDSSFDTVDVTPGIEMQRSVISQSYLNSHMSVASRCLKISPKSMQQCCPLGETSNNNNMQRTALSTARVEEHVKRSAEQKDLFVGKQKSNLPKVAGISSLKTVHTPTATCSKFKIPAHSMNSSPVMSSSRTSNKSLHISGITEMSRLGRTLDLSYRTPEKTTQSIRRLEEPFQSDRDLEEKEELPDTQPVSSLLLKDIIAYVEVRSGGDNRSMGVKAHLKSLGATVRDKFTNDVTHVVFNEGLWSTYKKAVSRKVHLVSVLWIEECKNAQAIVSERLYPPFDMEKYESPNLLKKFRKVKSFQPDFGDSEEEKTVRRRHVPDALTYKKKIKVPDFLENVSNENGLVRTLLSVADIGPEYEEAVNRPTSPTWSDEEDFSIPLAVRLLRKMLTPQSSPEVRSGESAENLNVTPVSKNTRSDGSWATNIEKTPKYQSEQSKTARNIEFDDLLSKNALENPKRNSHADNALETCTKDTEKSSVPECLTSCGSNNVSLMKPCTVPLKHTLSNTKRKATKSNVCNLKPTKSEALHNDEELEKDIKRMSRKRKHRRSEEDVEGQLDSKSVSQSTFSSKNTEKTVRNNARCELLTEEIGSELGKSSQSLFNGSNKEMSTRKRKLFPNTTINSLDVLDISTVQEEEATPSVQFPYTPGKQTIRRKKKNVLFSAGEGTSMELTRCADSTETPRQTLKSRKRFDFSSSVKHETVSKVACYARRSIDDFARSKQAAKNEEKSQHSKKDLPSLVCTGLHRHEVEAVTSVVLKLGGFILEPNVSERTTHVITSGPRRTINLLKGIARGCWILQQEWVLKSLDSEVWLEEDEFELLDFSPAVQVSIP